MNADPIRVRAVFLEAVEKHPPETWDQFLDEACTGQDELRRQVAILLDAHRQAGSFLADFAAPPEHLCNPSPPDARDTVIGPYRLLQQIGEGGMGTVFMAEQSHPVQRKVALKVIKPGMDSRQVIARFEAERQALALMDHPNIAKVLDAGQTPLVYAAGSQRPYFVMELVKGLPITQFCDDRRLTPHERLALFVPVCHAVQHAHQKGIIHRDLKPSNVLVCLYDGKPVPKIIDFGVAKATGPKLTERTLYTEFGAVVGTLEYMSPEQAELNQLDIDTRSDIYSLGVLLYELLTGTTPLERRRLKDSSLLEALRIIREEEPPRPSTRLSASDELSTIATKRSLDPKKLNGLVRRELDWIVMKALEKSRERRYQTASSLARDVERYLHDEPVEACPPSAYYRLRKYAWRNKAAMAMAAVLASALLVIVGTIAGSVGWVLRDQDARRARTDDAIHAALKEVKGLQKERKWTEALAGMQRVEELLSLREGSPDLDESARELRTDLEMARKLDLIRIRGVQATQDFADSDAAHGRAFREYGIDCEALDAAVAGERLRARAIAVELAMSLDDWAMVQRRLGKHGGNGWKHLLAVARHADPDPWRVRLRDALERNQPDVLKALANASEMPTMPLQTLNRLAKSLADVHEWDAMAQLLLQVQRLNPSGYWTNSLLAWALDQQEPPRSVAAARYATVAASVHHEYEVFHFNLGWYLERAGQFDDAVAAYVRAIQIRPDYAEAYDNLGRALTRAKAVGPAVSTYENALKRKPDWPQGHYYLGVALKKKNDLDGAALAFREALRRKPTLAAARDELLNILLEQGKDAEAEALFKKSLVALEEAVAREPKQAAAHIGLAWTLTNCPAQKLRHPSRALATAQKAVELDPKSSLAWQVFGWALYRTGDWKASIDALEKSMALQQRPPGGDSWQWFFLAMAHWRDGNYDQARVWYERAVKWLVENAPHNAEGKRLQAEAAALLEMKSQPEVKQGS
jgi:serine/threonine protein kinase/Tfp pilus assembly protein PilF